MRPIPRLLCVAAVLAAVGGMYWLMRAVPPERPPPVALGDRTIGGPTPARTTAPTYPIATFLTLPDPNAPGTSARVFIDPVEFDADVFEAAARSKRSAINDATSLVEYRQAIAGRVARARARLEGQSGRLQLGPAPTPAQIAAAVDLCRESAFVALYDGDQAAAKSWLLRGLPMAKMQGDSTWDRAQMTALLGLNALRRGEQDNCIACVGPSSCIFPIAPEAVHTRPSGSREAVEWFTAYLEEWPGDLRVRWLLNIAHMTLGEYPGGVPPKFLIPAGPSRPVPNLGRFENVASLVGLVARGPDLAGGCLFDDFTGDGLPDVLTTTFDVTHGASLYVNRGDGTFEDRSSSAGLDDQVYALNGSRADFDNDGDLDVLFLRGAWEGPARMSLLRNNGCGVFEDVTVASGLGEPIATESGVWGDYDDDGRIDLFVCGEYVPMRASGPDQQPGKPDPRNQCRLYRNQGNGTFVDVAAAAGVLNKRWAKGSAWDDYDGDGRIDLFVSNMGSAPRLYHNEGNGTFLDVAPSLGIGGSPHGFACLFWDYDNDGRPDIFVTDWGGSLAEFVASHLGLPVVSENHANLYHNLGDGGFREVSREAGLDRPLPVMSVNAGDIDNDGDLDLHLGTGWMSLSGLVPDQTLVNAGGRFDDVTEATATGHLQKGHGVSFADWDDDGDLDLFVVLGGGYPGDRGYNALFQNPGNGRHWLKVKLIGTTTNRSAIGAKIEVRVNGNDKQAHSVHRTVGNNGSFGGNSLVEFIGLGSATTVDGLIVTWPTSKTTQTFRDVPADQSLEITEGNDAFKVVPHKPLQQPKVPHGGDHLTKPYSSKDARVP
jgi:FG-GAP-like repeat/ASPIC and UnbV